MAQNYTVAQGDCLSSIARRFGFKSYHKIYHHPNNSAFREKRPNPNIIYPGDFLFIPDPLVKEEACATDKRHRFSLLRTKVLLRIRLEDRQQQPYKYKRYKVEVGQKTCSGHTNEKGIVEELIPADATTGTLFLWLSDESDEQASIKMPLNIGHLDPVDEITGAQARLNHLGYECGEVDGILGPKTESALRAFQRDFGLEETGKTDAPTCKKLQQLHDDE